MASASALTRRTWLAIVLIGLVGQLAWTIENMYLNVFVFETITSNPVVIATLVAASAITAALTTLVIGPLSDRLGRRRPFIIGGYLAWGVAVAAFGLVSVGGPLGASVTAAAVLIIALDCVMTFFGSTANDAAYQAWVTDVTTPDVRGRVDSVVQTLPLIAMLLVFVALDPLTRAGQWQLFFGIVGAIVLLAGLAATRLVRDAAQPSATSETLLAAITHGFRPSAVRANPLLYLALLTWAITGIASQVFMPYLLIYLDHYLRLPTYALVLGGVLIVAGTLTMLGGRLIDRFGKGHVIMAVIALNLVGLLVFAPARSTITVLGAGIVLMTGMMLTNAVLAAITRDLSPTDRVGHVQGLRILLVVMVPMIIGPFIGAAAITGSNETYVDLGVTRLVPTPTIFFVAAAILILALLPANSLRKRLPA